MSCGMQQVFSSGQDRLLVPDDYFPVNRYFKAALAAESTGQTGLREPVGKNQ